MIYRVVKMLSGCRGRRSRGRGRGLVVEVVVVLVRRGRDRGLLTIVADVIVVFGLPVIGQGSRQANTHTSETAAHQGTRTCRKIFLANSRDLSL